jgi:hypothetical protein
MKKLSLLMALMLLVTVSGVYAAWTYAGSDDIADVLAEAKVTIADVELTGANGTYKIESNLVLTVDQNKENDNHEAVLVFSSNNNEDIYLRVTFTPSKNAPQDIKDNAVPSELYFTTSTTMEYKMDANGNYSETGTPVAIFNFSNPGNGHLDNEFGWTKSAGTNANGVYVFTYELNEDQLKTMIMLNTPNDKPFKLDTKAEHDAFRAALAGNIVARVTDGTIN